MDRDIEVCVCVCVCARLRVYIRSETKVSALSSFYPSNLFRTPAFTHIDNHIPTLYVSVLWNVTVCVSA